MTKVISYSELSYIPPKTSVLVGGCFDVIHVGHIEFLKRAKEKGDFLIIALESDEFIEQSKHRKPFHIQEERAYILSYLKMVDMVIMLPHFTSYKEYSELVMKIKPSIIAVTAGDPFVKEKRKQAEKVGASVVEVVPLISNKSSSLLREFILKTQKDVL